MFILQKQITTSNIHRRLRLSGQNKGDMDEAIKNLAQEFG